MGTGVPVPVVDGGVGEGEGVAQTLAGVPLGATKLAPVATWAQQMRLLV